MINRGRRLPLWDGTCTASGARGAVSFCATTRAPVRCHHEGTHSGASFLANRTLGRAHWVALLLLIAHGGGAVLAAPRIDNVTPSQVWNTRLFHVRITGSGFVPDAQVALSRKGEAFILATEVLVPSPTEITAVFDVTGALAGHWDLAVQQGVEGDLRSGALTVRAAAEFKRLASWGGPVQGMDIVGSIGFVARGAGLVILDLTNPSNMIELGVLDVGAPVHDVAVRGNYAFVGANPPMFLTVVDVADLANPRIVTSGLTPIGASATDITIVGDVAYVTFGALRDTFGNFYAIDISNPLSLAPETARFQRAGGNIVENGRFSYAATVDGSYLYNVAFRNDSGHSEPVFQVWDISQNPLDPLFVATTGLFLTSAGATDIAVANGYAYITGGGKLNIVDVTNPMSPSPIGLLADVSGAVGVAVSNGTVYVAGVEFAKGMVAVDVTTDPALPAVTGEFMTRARVRGVEINGTTAYLFDEGEGLVALDISVPNSPSRVGLYYSPGYFGKIDKEGDVLYLSDFWNGLTAVNVADPSRPTLLGYHQTPTIPITGQNGAAVVRNGLAYFAAGGAGLQIVDFSTPASPVVVGGWTPDPERINSRANSGVALKDDTLIVSVSNEGNRVFRLATPTTPFFVGWIGTWEQGGVADLDWEISDQMVAYSATVAGLCRGEIYSAAESDLGAFIGCYSSSRTIDVELSGGRFYAVVESDFGGLRGLAVYDVLETGDVSLLADLGLRGAKSLSVRNDHVYVGGGAICNASDQCHLTITVWDVAGIELDGELKLMGSFDENGRTTIRTLYADEPFLYGVGLHDDAHGTVSKDGGSGLVLFQVSSPGSLRADGDVDLKDVAGLQNCFAGGVSAGAGCSTYDFDNDGGVDSDDLRPFTDLMTGPLPQ